MKKHLIILLALWTMACTIVLFPKSPSGERSFFHVTFVAPTRVSPSMNPSTSMTPAVTVSPWAASTYPIPPTTTSTREPARFPATLIVPTPQIGSSPKLISIQMIDAHIGWAIQEESREVLRPGYRMNYPWPPEGYILRTTDGGKTWQNVTPPTGAYSPGGFFALDANTAWASDNSTGLNPIATRVWHTTNGGQTWQASQPFLVADWSDFYLPSRMQFIDQNTGWLLALIEAEMNGAPVGEALFRSTDGGNTWEGINSCLEDLGGCGNGGLAFSSSKTGWYGGSCVGDGKTGGSFNLYFAKGSYKIRHTTDGGKSFPFQAMIPVPHDLQKLAGTNPDMSCGERRLMTFTPEVVGIEWECQLFWQPDQDYRYFSLSTDAGRTWNTWQPTGNEYFFDATHGWRLLSPGQLQQTIDSGANWVTIKIVAWDEAKFDFVSEQEGWALIPGKGATALVHTMDGGSTWEKIKPVIISP